VNPTYCGTKFVIVNCIFLPIAFISLVIRVWTRMFIARGFRWDDCECSPDHERLILTSWQI
jgi:hypothetical protein